MPQIKKVDAYIITAKTIIENPQDVIKIEKMEKIILRSFNNTQLTSSIIQITDEEAKLFNP